MSQRRKNALIFALAAALVGALAAIILDDALREALGPKYYVVGLTIIGCVLLLLSGYVWDRTLHKSIRELGGKIQLPTETVVDAAEAPDGSEPGSNEQPSHDDIINLARRIEGMAHALQKTEASYRGIVEDQIDLICRYKPDGRLTFVNGAYARFFGKTRQELLGQIFAPLKNGLRDQLNLHNPPPVASFEYELKGAHGVDAWYLWTNRVILGKDGTLLEFQAVGHDVTLRREAEAAMRRAKEAAESADQAKSEFLAIVSHEIRTPINGIIGFTRLLTETPLTAEQKEFLEIISTSGQTLQVLINDLLDLSKIEAGKIDLQPAPFAPRKLIEEVCAFHAHKAREAGLNLELHMDPGIPTIVTGDHFRLRQVLNNLVGNAVKFTEKGGIVIKASAIDDELALPSVSKRKLILSISVRDTGIGIPQDKLSLLFKPFSQVDTSLKRRHGGTGLGLSISKKICELMGGEIKVESHPGEGSTFHFTVKVECDNKPSVEPASAV